MRQLPHHGFGVIGLAHADPAAGDGGIGLACGALESGLQRRGLIGYDAQIQHLNTHALQHAKHGVAVAVIHRAFPRRVPQAQNFVTGAEISHPQARVDRQLRNAQAGNQAQRGRGDPGAAYERSAALAQVFSGLAAVVAAVQQPGRYGDGVAVKLHQFLGNHGIEPCGHDGTGHDLHAFPSY